MPQRRIDRIALLKMAAAAVAATSGTPAYSVVSGDTLSGIARRNNTTWRELARLNGIPNPNRIMPGQRLKLPQPKRPAPAAPAAPVAPTTPSTPLSRMNHVAARLHTKLNNPALEAGILANFNRETGGSFDYATAQKGGGGGYGIPQYTGASLKAYNGWLATNKRTDSADSQIDYFTDKYMPSRPGYKTYMAPGAKFTREQYADWLHRRVFTPAHTIPTHKGYSAVKIDAATRGHNDFMKNRLKAVNGVWQGVKTAEAMLCKLSEKPTGSRARSEQYERPYTARQMLAAGYRKELVNRLMRDPVHRWRARTGIELVHREPDLKEAIRVWVNWHRMSEADRARSDRKSIALFGVDNKTHYRQLRPTYDEGKEIKS